MNRLFRYLQHRYMFYGLLLGAMLLKYFPFGIQYFTYQDDNNQYGVYHLIGKNLWENVIIGNKLYSNRPLAALTDAYLISPLWNHLWLVLLVMILLHFATIYLLDRIFTGSGIAWGRAAALSFGLYPLLAEASYWISASSRLVIGLFFSVLSVYWMLRFGREEGITKGKRIACLVGAAVTGLLAQGYYEQVIAFHFVFAVGMLIINHRKLKYKWVYALPVVSFLAIGGYYFAFRNVGGLSARGQMNLSGLADTAGQVLHNIYALFILEERFTIYYTITQGLYKLLTQHTVLFILVLLISGLLALSLYAEKTENEAEAKAFRPGLSLLAGLLLFIVPFGPYFVLSDAYLYLRNIFVSIAGIGIAVQVIWHYAARKRALKIVGACIGFAVIVICMGCNIFEVEGYRITEKHNKQIAQSILHAIEKADKPHEQVYVFNVRYEYEPMPAPHFASATIADWSLVGQVEVEAGKLYDNSRGCYTYPILNGQSYEADTTRQGVLLLALDNDYKAREAYRDGDQMFFADTREPLGYFEMLEQGSWRFLRY